MKNVWFAVIIVGVLAAVLIADWPSGGGFQLRWGAVTNGGTERGARMSTTGYQLSDNLGNASHVTDSFLTDGTTFIHRTGYRKVDWDERHPITSVNDLGADTISSAPNFPISWGGADTTIEDGYGWGIRFYDVQYRINLGGTWEDWYVQTVLISDIFGPTYGLGPGDTICEDTTYFFRCRAYDLPGNVEDWPTTPDYQAWARYEEQILEWVVVNQADSNDWTIEDSLTMGYTATMEAGDLFIVKNNGTVAIDMGIKGYPATGWTIGNTPSYDRYALRARFNDDPTPPVTFPLTDAVFDSGFTWATGRTTDPDTLYGLLGWGIQDATADSVDRTDNLWLQLHLPTDVSTYIDSQIIRIDLKAKASAP